MIMSFLLDPGALGQQTHVVERVDCSGRRIALAEKIRKVKREVEVVLPASEDEFVELRFSLACGGVGFERLLMEEDRHAIDGGKIDFKSGVENLWRSQGFLQCSRAHGCATTGNVCTATFQLRPIETFSILSLYVHSPGAENVIVSASIAGRQVAKWNMGKAGTRHWCNIRVTQKDLDDRDRLTVTFQNDKTYRTSTGVLLGLSFDRAVQIDEKDLKQKKKAL